MTDMIDSNVLEPNIDPKTKKIGVRHVKATNAAGADMTVTWVQESAADFKGSVD
jgi:hypothetical protein